MCTRVSPFYSTVIKAADFDGLSNHNTPKKEGIGVGVGYFQSVFRVARTFDSQITAWAHLCRLFSEEIADSRQLCGLFAQPKCLDLLSLLSVLFPKRRFLTLALSQALSDLQARP